MLIQSKVTCTWISAKFLQQASKEQQEINRTIHGGQIVLFLRGPEWQDTFKSPIPFPRVQKQIQTNPVNRSDVMMKHLHGVSGVGTVTQHESDFEGRTKKKKKKETSWKPLFLPIKSHHSFRWIGGKLSAVTHTGALTTYLHLLRQINAFAEVYS